MFCGPEHTTETGLVIPVEDPLHGLREVVHLFSSTSIFEQCSVVSFGILFESWAIPISIIEEGEVENLDT